MTHVPRIHEYQDVHNTKRIVTNNNVTIHIHYSSRLNNVNKTPRGIEDALSSHAGVRKTPWSERWKCASMTPRGWEFGGSNLWPRGGVEHFLPSPSSCGERPV